MAEITCKKCHRHYDPKWSEDGKKCPYCGFSQETEQESIAIPQNEERAQFFDTLFGNTGEKLQKIAKILFVLNIIGAVMRFVIIKTTISVLWC